MAINKNFSKLLEEEDNRPNTEELRAYNDFEVKERLFGNYFKIDDISTLHSLLAVSLPKIQQSTGIIFRGVSEASYRLFNKAQRCFSCDTSKTIKHGKLYHDLIGEMIANAKNVNNHILTKYFEAFGGKCNDVAILSFLQHHGAPTPIMDWTTDIDVALFFATRNLTFDQIYARQQATSYTHEIKDYFSIYFLAEQSTRNTIPEFKPLSINTKTSSSYTTLKKKRVSYLIEQSKSGKPKFILNNNFNILSQKGVFVYHNSSKLPLEEAFMKYSLMYYLYYKSRNENVIRSPLGCIDVHKSLADYIKLKLEDIGYFDSTIFPRSEDIARLSIPRNLQNVIF